MTIKPRFKHLRAQLTLALLFVAVMPLTVATMIIYNQRVAAIEEEAYIKLQGVRDLKAQELNRWMIDLKADIAIIAGDEDISAAMESPRKPNGTTGPEDKLQIARNHLKRRIEYSGIYEEIIVVESDSARIRLYSNGAQPEEDASRNISFLTALQTGRVFIRDIYLSERLKRPTMDAAAPVYGLLDPKKVVGVVIARIDLPRSLYELLLNRAGMGKTGETLLVNQDVVALGPLRWHDNAPLKLKIRAEPAVLAAKGQTGIVETDDYRGEPVLAAYTHIDEMNWGFVAKQDQSEIYAQVQSLINSLALLLAVSLIAVAAISYFLAGDIVKPVLEMAGVARELRKGNLAARNELDLPNELGVLARSLNDMAGALGSQMDIQEKSATIRDSMAVSTDIAAASHSLIEELVEVTGAALGVFYLRAAAGRTFEPIASVGADTSLLKSFDGATMEGELGRALASSHIHRTTAIPEDTRFVHRTASGTMVPKEMIAVPLLVDHEAHAVVCLAAIKPFSDQDLKALERAWPSLNMAMANLSAGRKTRLLAEELSRKNTELLEQARELRIQASELEAQRLQVEEADRLKSEFLSNMSHELRTPLNSVITLSELMISRGPGKNPEKDIEYLRIVQQNGYHLLSLINDILDLSKIEAGHMELSLDDFEPRRPLERAVETARPLAAKKGLKLDVRIADVPPMHSDESRIYQVLLNLLSNAVKFTAQGGVEALLERDGNKIVFAVRDTGIGIPAEELPHIFDQFRQVDGSATRYHEGTGLGLAICRQLAALLGGSITVESTAGVGSTFRLTLPEHPEQPKRKAPPLHSAAPAPAVDRKTIEKRAFRGKTILVVDDELSTCEAIRGFLENSGYQVVTATSGDEALRLADKIHPFAMTLDVLMPDMDGWEVLKKLKSSKTTSAIPVIIVSQSKDQATGMALGATTFMAKPVTLELLLSELEKIARWRTVRNILIADDDAAVREHLTRTLEERQYRVVAVAGGKEALALISSYLPDALVLDLMMPEVDGFEVLSRLRADMATHDLPVVVVTAKDLTLEEKRWLNKSAERVIEKGVLQWSRLLEEVENALEGLERRALTHGGGDRSRILVVEDNEIAVLQIRTALEENGFDVVVARGGEDALASFALSLPDAVVLDLMMPGVDGFEVLERIRSTPWTNHLPVLVLTAKELTSEERARLTHNNVQELVQKGALRRDELVERVRALVKKPPQAPATSLPEDWIATNTSGREAAAPRRVPIPGAKSVLIVEDNDDNSYTIAEILAEMGLTHMKVVNGAQAVEIARTAKPDLILLDIQLPGMSGLEAARLIRADKEISRTPIIAMTAKAMKGDKEEILAAGCNAYLSKPLTAAEVMELIRKWID